MDRLPRRRIRGSAIAAAAAAFALLAACDTGSVTGRDAVASTGVFYGLGDDHRLYRWDPDGEDGGEGALTAVLDLSGVWEGQGDVGTVLRASLSIDPEQRYAAWVAGASASAVLKFGDLGTGETTDALTYPVDHACIDPTWLADGSALLVHRAPVWGVEDSGDYSDGTPLPLESWGPLEWHSPEAGELPSTVDLPSDGCRIRWYTAEDGSAQAVYHDLDVDEFYRIDVDGNLLETISVPGLQGTEPITTGLVGIDPTGRYVCVVDGYGPLGAFKGGFTTRAESGTRVIDLETGDAVGVDEGAGCTSLYDGGYAARDGKSVSIADFDGRSLWAGQLPGTIAESAVLFYFPDEESQSGA